MREIDVLIGHVFCQLIILMMKHKIFSEKALRLVREVSEIVLCKNRLSFGEK